VDLHIHIVVQAILIKWQKTIWGDEHVWNTSGNFNIDGNLHHNTFMGVI
jgi:hypothetical protein